MFYFRPNKQQHNNYINNKNYAWNDNNKSNYNYNWAIVIFDAVF